MTDPQHWLSNSPQQPNQPLPPDQWRPSESDRRAAADRLRTAVDEGRLNLTEYDQRLRASEMAGTMEQLNRVIADLPGPPEQVLVQIGEIAVTATTIHTPSGPIPLRGSQWAVNDQWLSEQKTPTWAIVLAIVGFFLVCAFSLLFLLAKETQFHGTVNVTVSNGSQQYVARIPVYNQQQVHHIYNQVNYVRSLTMR
jgi:uncharacterized protein DUF1707